MGDFSTFAGLGGSGVPPDLINVGFPIDTNLTGIDLQQLLDQLNLAPQPLTGGAPPIDTSTLPTLPPIDTGLLGGIPPPELPLPAPPVSPLPPPALPPIGYDSSGNPIYSVTGTTPTPQPQPVIQPPQFPQPTQGPTVTYTTSGGGGPVTVNVTVNNAENIANDVIAKLQQAVTDAITGSVQDVADITKSVFQAIGDALKNIAQTIWDALKSALQAIASQIANVIGGIAGAIKDAAVSIFKGLGQIFGQLKDVLISVINKIGPVLTAIARTINRINNQIIVPIATFINTTVRTIAALTVAIEKDLHDGLAGIIRIPGDIAAGIQSLDASLNRTVQQLGQFNRQVATDTLIDFSGKNVSDNLRGVSDSVAGLASTSPIATTYTVHDKLGEACNLAGLSDKVNSLIPDTSGAGTFLKFAHDVIFGLFILLSQVKSTLEKAEEAATETINASCPLKKLDGGTLTDAVRRNFITSDQMDQEMLKQGFDTDRSKLLRDLSKYVESSQDLSEYRFRNIITDSDFVDGLSILGFSPAQIDAFREVNYKLLDPQVASLAWLRGIIDETTVDKTLQVNRYDDAQTTLLKTLARRPPNVDEALAGTHNRELLGGVFGTGSDWDAIPDWYQSAGRAQGFDDNTVKLSWWVHFFTGDIQTWLNLYFRGVRTGNELQAFLDSRGVPREFQGDLIEANRPLLPFRSLPTYVKAGVLSDARARSILSAHGFHIEDINAIMDLIGVAGKSTKAKTAGGIQTLSVANAKTLFNDGAIDQTQYESILVQHGYTAELASAQAEVDTINAHARQRKTTLTNYYEEVLAGVISIDDAIAQLNQQGFTVTEIQTWQAKTIRAMRIGTHRPSLGQLDSYLKDGSITLDQYRQELVNQNWTEPWLSAQVSHVTPK